MLGSALGSLSLVTLSTLPYIEQKSVYAGGSARVKYPESNPSGFKHPGERNLPYEKVDLETEDRKVIHGWLMLQPNSPEVPTLVYFHSNTGNRGYRLGHIEEFYRTLGVNVFIFDYRGYGESTDTPTEAGLMHDAEAVLEYVRFHPKIDNRKIIIYGRSLGGAVGIYAASKFDYIWALIVENTFTSLPTLISQTYSLGPYLSRMMNNEWPSIERIKEIECPIMFISGRKDTTVPPDHMDELHANAQAAIFKEIKRVPEGTHNNVRKVVGDEYREWISDFIGQLNR